MRASINYRLMRATKPFSVLCSVVAETHSLSLSRWPWRAGGRRGLTYSLNTRQRCVSADRPASGIIRPTRPGGAVLGGLFTWGIMSRHRIHRRCNLECLCTAYEWRPRCAPLPLVRAINKPLDKVTEKDNVRQNLSTDLDETRNLEAFPRFHPARTDFDPTTWVVQFATKYEELLLFVTT